MRTPKEIQADIRELKREMQQRGIRRVSCFNGGLTPLEQTFNATLFNLNTELKTVKAVIEATNGHIQTVKTV